MKRRNKMIMLLTITIGLFVLAGAHSTLAWPSQTGECGSSGCHNTYTLTLTSNATGTVSATVGVSFDLVVDAGNGADALKIYNTWADNAQFAFSPSGDTAINDGDAADTNANSGEITVTYTITPQSAGSYSIQIWTAAGGDLAKGLSVSVSVVAPDTTPPTIDSPADKNIAEGSTGNSITWTPTDSNPSTYEILRDGSIVDSGSWTSGNPITISVDGLSLGTYNYTIQVSDVAGNDATDQVDVTVYDGTVPIIDNPSDVAYDEGATGNSISWTPTDSHPTTYEILRNGSVVDSGSWTSGNPITISVDGLGVGTYNYTIVVTDVGSNTATDLVYVTVSDATSPTIDNPSDVAYDEGATGNSITWTPNDLNPTTYEILRNGSVVDSGSWTSGNPITISVDGLGVGTYNYTIVVTDVGGNTATDLVYVTVSDATSPTIDNPSDVAYDEGATGNSITWTPNDLNPTTYEILRNGSVVDSGSWTSGNPITISVDGLGWGVYNYTIVVTDVGGNTATDLVYVTVSDATPPTIDNPIDQDVVEGSTGNSITWDPQDTNPVSYDIYRNGTLVKSGAWNLTSETISVSVDGLTLGTYNFTIVVTDIDGNTATDIVWVTVYDGTVPTTDHPSNVSYPDGGTGNSITWTAYDIHPISYEVYRNGTLVKSGTWNATGETITVVVDGLSIAVYNFTLVVTDIGGNIASDLVYVTVYSTVVPTIDHPPDQIISEGSTGNMIVWDPLDVNPSNYEIYKDSILVKIGLWNSSSETISISIDGLSLGTYNYTIVVYNQGGYSTVDTVIVTVIDGTTPVVDSPSDIAYNEGDTGYSITWTPTDLHPTTYQILRNGTLVDSGSWTSGNPITIVVDGLGVGTYNFTIVLTDVGNNIVTNLVWVTVLDVIPPVVDSPSDVAYNEGDTGSSITWTPTDLHPTTYKILRNGTLVDSGSWTSGNPIVISVDGLGWGVYNYTIVVTDIGDNTATDLVWVTVSDATPPTIDSPTDQDITEGSTGNSITWDPQDINPVSYDIYRNGTFVKSGAWNSTSETITVSVDGLTLGTYNFTIVVTDIDGNTATDIVWITVQDTTSPAIDSPTDQDIAEGSTGNSITWDPQDTNPVSYDIYRNGTLVKSGVWNSTSETISVSVDGLAFGTYNFTIVVTDIAGNTATDIVWITVQDSTPPTIDSPDDISYAEDGTGYSITWNPQDINPTSYDIYKDDVVVKSGVWNSTSETIEISVDGLTLGNYNFTIVVLDVGGNSVKDTVMVNVYDGTLPTIDSPADQNVAEASTGNSITWDPQDTNPVSYNIYKDDAVVKTGVWNSTIETITISVDGLTVGYYNYTIVVTDTEGNTAKDTVIVTVSDATPPTIDSPDDIAYDEGTTGHSITWDPQDTNPVSYDIYRNEILVKSGTWNSTSETISISVDGLTSGTYNYTIVSQDVGGNNAIDMVLVVVSALTTTTTTTTTPTNTTAPTDQVPASMMMLVISGVTGAVAIVIVLLLLRRRE